MAYLDIPTHVQSVNLAAAVYSLCIRRLKE
jgi:hypothetical protein